MDEELDHNAALASTTEGFKTDAKADEVGTKEKKITGFLLQISLFQPFIELRHILCIDKKSHGAAKIPRMS